MRVPKPIDGYGKSYAMLSKSDDVDTAVIFVHGFGGKPTSTWRDFHGLVDEYSQEYNWWARSDMFFYAYDSLRTPIRRNAALLAAFVERVWGGKWQGRRSTKQQSLKYKSLILVGHSEGGVIIRRLILDRYERLKQAVEKANRAAAYNTLKTKINAALEADFLLNATLRLFAPACRGTNFSSLLGFSISFAQFLATVAASALVKNELLPDSPVLTSLKSGTERAHAEFREIRSLYTQPLFGVPDQIVISDSYEGEELEWDEGYDHFSVCKPSYTHKRPLEFVRK